MARQRRRISPQGLGQGRAPAQRVVRPPPGRPHPLRL